MLAADVLVEVRSDRQRQAKQFGVTWSHRIVAIGRAVVELDQHPFAIMANLGNAAGFDLLHNQADGLMDVGTATLTLVSPNTHCSMVAASATTIGALM